MAISDLPALNATLNGIAGGLLAAGYYFIRRKRIAAHRACMLSAFAASTLFLVSYVIYHAHVGSRPFPRQGSVRLLYFAILDHAHRLRGSHRTDGVDHSAPRLEARRRASSSHCAMDVADLDVRVSDRGHHLLDAIQALLTLVGAAGAWVRRVH